jgi:hypothetical protein
MRLCLRVPNAQIKLVILMSPSERTKGAEASVLFSSAFSKFLLTSHKCDQVRRRSSHRSGILFLLRIEFVPLPPLVRESGGRSRCFSVCYTPNSYNFKILKFYEEKNRKCVSNRCLLRLVAALLRHDIVNATPFHTREAVCGLHLLGGAFWGPH